MTIHSEDTWIQVAEYNEDREIVFTKEYLDATRKMGGMARKFAAMLISHWDLKLSKMLDYFGPEDFEDDLYSGIDGDPMDVVEDIPEIWEYHDMPFPGLDSEWYRDIMRAKLVSLRVPLQLINKFAEAANKNI